MPKSPSRNGRWFVDRNNINYLNLLTAKLDIESLISSAIPITNDKRGYQKIIRIDFCGIAGSTFLLGNINQHQEKIKNKFLDLFKHLDRLEKEKIRLKTRFIFMYLYSDFSYAQIEAEKTDYRATIKNPQYDDYENMSLFSLTDKDFYSSRIFDNQKNALKQIQSLHNKYFRRKDYSEILNIRFSCVPLNLCQITINNDTFIDPYAYAKKDQHSPLAYETPVVHIHKPANNNSFNILEDHFRYIWNHPTTLFYEDCTKAFIDSKNDHRLERLSEIKIPSEVNFDYKMSRFKERFPGNTDEKLNRWKFQVERMFSNMTRVIETTPESETIFIGFSFKNGKHLADEIRNFLESDFPDSLNINIVDLIEGKQTLYRELIDMMNGATIGLMFFTRDLKEDDPTEEKHYSRPNLYFEFGYLLKHVEKFGPPIRRIMAFKEDKLIVPSDFQDIFQFRLQKNSYLDYIYILERILSVNKTLTERVASQAVSKMFDRLQIAYDTKKVNDADIGQPFAEFKSTMKKRLIKNINKRFNQSKRGSID